MNESQRCPRCGATMPQAVRGGHCLRCLLELGLTSFDESGDAEPAPGEPSVASTTPSSAERPGDRIGRFRLLEQIGEGGFGIVFRAQQEEPVSRLVALKIIKLGMDTKNVVARFEAERQALALMDHVNIAKVLDGGATATGRPYFVMDLVHGPKITDYCDANRLSLSERLELFMQVCHAIQHAHHKGIVHRDIKPSNVLVAEQDGLAIPKVIDFGIASATMPQRVSEQTMLTSLQQFAGTPAYMSPEQAGSGAIDIDARSDIYSLGALLYELLTAQPTFDPAQLGRAGVDEIFRALREQEPQRPSSRLATLSRQNLTKIAECRQTESTRLPSLLRGDLDWIVVKALEKDRNRRYETADGLAMDIQRHLNQEPVFARPPTKVYRVQKLIRRNKLAFGAVAAVAVSLLIGFAVATWLYLQERAARHRAVTAEREARDEAGKSSEVAQFLKDMLAGVGPSAALGRDTTLLREILDRTGERLGRELKNQPAVAADLLNLLGNVYEELGEYQKAEASLRRALALRTISSGTNDLNYAVSLNGLANVLGREAKLPEAETLSREALRFKRNLLGNQHPEVAVSLNNLGTLLWRQNKLPEAESFYRESLAVYRKLPGDQDAKIAMALGNLGNLFAVQQKTTEAESMFREALALQRKVFGEQHPVIAKTLSNLANALSDQGKLAEAESMFREAVELRRKLLGNAHPDLAISLNNLAEVLRAEKKLEQAENLHREALAIRQKALGQNHPDVALSLNNLGNVLQGRGNLKEAEATHREALALRENLVGEHGLEVAQSLNGLANALADQGRLGEAETLHRKALAILQKAGESAGSDLANELNNLVDLLEREGKLAEAEQLRLQAGPHPLPSKDRNP